MVPGMLLQRVDRSDIVAGDPSHATVYAVRFAPFPGLVVGQDSNLNIHFNMKSWESLLCLSVCMSVDSRNVKMHLENDI